MESRNSRPCSPRLLSFVRELSPLTAGSSLPALHFFPSPRKPSSRLSTPSPIRDSLTSRDISHRKDLHKRVLSTDFNSKDAVTALLTLKAGEGGLPTDLEELKRKRKEHSMNEALESVPTGRRDVEVLATWLDFMLKKISNGDLSDHAKVYEQVQLVYESSFREMLKQVHSQCSERGLLLQRIWLAYQGLSNRYVKQAQNDIARMQEEWKGKLKSATLKSKAKEDDMQRIIYEKDEVCEELRQQIATLQQEAEKNIRQQSRQAAQIVQLQSSLTKCKRKLYYLREDNRVLSIQLRNCEVTDGVSQKAPRTRFKKRSVEMIEELIAKDPEIQHMNSDNVVREPNIAAYEEEVERAMCQPDFREEMTSVGDLVLTADCHVQASANVKDSGTQWKREGLRVVTIIVGSVAPTSKKIKSIQVNIEEVDNFQIDLHKIIGQKLTTEQIEAIEESLLSRFAGMLNQRPENSLDPSPVETIEIPPKNFVETSIANTQPDRETTSKAEEGPSKRLKTQLKTRVGMVMGLLQAKKERRAREPSLVETQGMQLVRKFVLENRKVRRILPKKTVSKLISWIYLEKIAQKKEKDSIQSDNLATFLFDLFMHKYGFEKLAEKKVNQLLGSCLVYRGDAKVGTFSRFLGLFGTCSSQEVGLYLRALDFATKNQLLLETESDVAFLPMAKVLECFKLLFESKAQVLQELKTRLEAIKPPDQKNSVKGLIEIETFLQEVLQLGRVEEKRAENFIRLLFTAANINGDEFLQLSEFQLLQKHVSSMDRNLAEALFHQSADISGSEGKEKAISLPAFLQMNTRWKLFTEEDLRSFEQGIADKAEMKKRAAEIIGGLKWRFGDKYTPTMDSNVQHLRSAFSDSLDPEAPWLALRLLDEESREVFADRLAVSFLPHLCPLFSSLCATAR